MKLMVLGSTGPTGQLVVSEALEKGHDVIALARTPEKLTKTHEKLKVVGADILSSAIVAEYMSGCNAVLSCVGGKPSVSTACDVYSKCVKATVEAMKNTGVQRLVCISSWGIKDDPRLPFVWREVLKPVVLRSILKDMEVMEEFLQSSECTDINYTVVRPPALLNTPSSGGQVQTMEDQLVVDAVSEMTRHDLAKFIIECLSNKAHDRKMIAVAAPKKDA